MLTTNNIKDLIKANNQQVRLELLLNNNLNNNFDLINKSKQNSLMNFKKATSDLNDECLINKTTKDKFCIDPSFCCIDQPSLIELTNDQKLTTATKIRILKTKMAPIKSSSNLIFDDLDKKPIKFDDTDFDLEYGPGIVSKLTRTWNNILSSRQSKLKRSSSLENILNCGLNNHVNNNNLKSSQINKFNHSSNSKHTAANGLLNGAAKHYYTQQRTKQTTSPRHCNKLKSRIMEQRNSHLDSNQVNTLNKTNTNSVSNNYFKNIKPLKSLRNGSCSSNSSSSSNNDDEEDEDLDYFTLPVLKRAKSMETLTMELRNHQFTFTTAATTNLNDNFKPQNSNRLREIRNTGNSAAGFNSNQTNEELQNAEKCTSSSINMNKANNYLLDEQRKCNNNKQINKLNLSSNMSKCSSIINTSNNFCSNSSANSINTNSINTKLNLTPKTTFYLKNVNRETSLINKTTATALNDNKLKPTVNAMNSTSPINLFDNTICAAHHSTNFNQTNNRIINNHNANSTVQQQQTNKEYAFAARCALPVDKVTNSQVLNKCFNSSTFCETSLSSCTNVSNHHQCLKNQQISSNYLNDQSDSQIKSNQLNNKEIMVISSTNQTDVEQQSISKSKELAIEDELPKPNTVKFCKQIFEKQSNEQHLNLNFNKNQFHSTSNLNLTPLHNQSNHLNSVCNSTSNLNYSKFKHNNVGDKFNLSIDRTTESSLIGGGNDSKSQKIESKTFDDHEIISDQVLIKTERDQVDKKLNRNNVNSTSNSELETTSVSNSETKMNNNNNNSKMKIIKDKTIKQGFTMPPSKPPKPVHLMKTSLIGNNEKDLKKEQNNFFTELSSTVAATTITAQNELNLNNSQINHQLTDHLNQSNSSSRSFKTENDKVLNSENYKDEFKSNDDLESDLIINNKLKEPIIVEEQKDKPSKISTLTRKPCIYKNQNLNIVRRFIKKELEESSSSGSCCSSLDDLSDKSDKSDKLSNLCNQNLSNLEKNNENFEKVNKQFTDSAHDVTNLVTNKNKNLKEELCNSFANECCSKQQLLQQKEQKPNSTVVIKEIDLNEFNEFKFKQQQLANSLEKNFNQFINEVDFELNKTDKLTICDSTSDDYKIENQNSANLDNFLIENNNLFNNSFEIFDTYKPFDNSTETKDNQLINNLDYNNSFKCSLDNSTTSSDNLINLNNNSKKDIYKQEEMRSYTLPSFSNSSSKTITTTSKINQNKIKKPIANIKPLIKSDKLQQQSTDTLKKYNENQPTDNKSSHKFDQQISQLKDQLKSQLKNDVDENVKAIKKNTNNLYSTQQNGLNLNSAKLNNKNENSKNVLKTKTQAPIRQSTASSYSLSNEKSLIKDICTKNSSEKIKTTTTEKSQQLASFNEHLKITSSINETEKEVPNITSFNQLDQQKLSSIKHTNEKSNTNRRPIETNSSSINSSSNLSVNNNDSNNSNENKANNSLQLSSSYDLSNDLVSNSIVGPSSNLNKPKKDTNQQNGSNSIVFDFRGTNVKANLTVRSRSAGGFAVRTSSQDDDDDFNYTGITTVPEPSGIIFNGENVLLEKSSLLTTRNKKASNFNLPMIYLNVNKLNLVS